MIHSLFIVFFSICILETSMADMHHPDDVQDPNGRLLSLVRWACREGHEILRLRPFRVRTPSVNRGRGRRVQIPRGRTPEGPTTPERMGESGRIAGRSRHRLLRELVEVSEFPRRIEMEAQDEIPAVVPESSSSMDDQVG